MPINYYTSMVTENKYDRFIGIIPARYASGRFPGKPLAKIGGISMIRRVYEQVSSVLGCVYVATDDIRIEKEVQSFGGNVVMTAETHQSGTDRCFEAYLKTGTDRPVIINIQGDEPFIHASQIESLCSCFDDNETEIATLAKPFPASSSTEDLFNPNSPKVVLNKNKEAMYFSRSVIPFIRGVEKEEWIQKHTFLKHIGLYAYRADILKEITQLPQSELELAESLEQLRWLENGFTIKVGITDIETIGIDTPEDLAKAELYLSNNRARK
jgi:3-deoxy-manno-octulosonate cytidylyltransferase (CMP-KDO synthetase)